MKSSETLRHQMTQSVFLTKLGNSRTPSFEKPFLAFLYPAQARRDLLQLVFRASRGVFDDQHLAGRHVAHGEQPESRHAREVGKLLICFVVAHVVDGFVIFFPLVVYSQGRDFGFATVVKQPRRVSVNRGVQHELVFRVHLDFDGERNDKQKG
jgi:hypothetical protein